jgi:sugar phosphate isomerase/epimerase
VDLYKVYADLAAELGAPIVTVHAGLLPDASRPRAVDQLRSSLDELARHVRGMPCAYAWENQAAGLSVDEHLQWIRELGLGTFGFVLDTGHSNIDGTTDAYMNACEGLLCSLHVNDNNGEVDQHTIPGVGSVAWEGFVSRLEQAAYTGPLMLEFEARERQDELEAVLAEARAAVDALKPY